MMNQEDEVRLVELTREDNVLREIVSKYSTSHYYDVSVHQGSGSWNINLTLRSFDGALEKDYRGRLFEDHVQEPRVFAAVQGNRQIGWIELGYDKWNNRMRVWEFLVEEHLRGRGTGRLLMNHAVRIGKEKGARMLVLETQTNNADAINFYLQFGFHLIGLDTAAYSNDDIGRKEVRLELGLEL